MANTGIDKTLALEAVYLSTPIPRNLAVLTVLGAVFDKVYFPGGYLPKTGYDEAALQREIKRLEQLRDPPDYETWLLINVLRILRHVKTLEGFCEFTGDPDDPLGRQAKVPAELLKAIDDSIFGPPPPSFIPSFSTNNVKGLPGGDEAVVYPGVHHYIGGALMHSAATGIPLLNDIPAVPIPGIPDTAPADNAKLLSAILAIECTRIALPPTPLMRPEDLMEFRQANSTLLRGFRRSMLRYAADLNSKIKGLSAEDFRAKTQFFVETEIVPTMDELNATMNDPARPWHRRAIDALKIIPQVGGAFLTAGPSAALTKAITTSAAQFFTEVAAKTDKAEAIKRSGLTYLLRMRAFQDARS
ncbi:MAG TPA: hypothetical protein VEK55_12430 [Xanthobacteraceae bacterium]|nr:hypothetical protein [Xanthobacteraceae bacterium]